MIKRMLLYLLLVAGGCTGPLERCGPENDYACAVRVHVSRDNGVRALGQGVVIGERTVLTAAHVVRDMHEIVVKQDGDPIGRSGTVVKHPTADLAIIHFWEDLDLPVAEITANPIEPGELALAKAKRDMLGAAIGPSKWDATDTIYFWPDGASGGDSGAGIFNSNGQLAAIHGGSRYVDNRLCGYAADLYLQAEWLDQEAARK